MNIRARERRQCANASTLLAIAELNAGARVSIHVHDCESAQPRMRFAAAKKLGLSPTTLYEQVARLERACGSQRFNRNPGSPAPHPEPLGRQLRQQARNHLGLQPDPRQVTATRPT